MYPKVDVTVVEQPAFDSIRFRYSSDDRFSGSIAGVNSTLDEPTSPTISIQTCNYIGPVLCITSCVTKDEPYKPHPNKLKGSNCKGGVHMANFVTDSSSPITITYRNLGIERGRHVDIINILNEREGMNIDPFATGFRHKYDKKEINMHEVRLCFQVFLTREKRLPVRSASIAPMALVSDPIMNNLNIPPDLVIFDISDPTSSVHGGKKIMIFCNKVASNDIEIRFFREDVSFDECVLVQSRNIHRQYAIVFHTPKYKFNNISDPVTVYIQLMRPSDGKRSEPLPFQYIPDFAYDEGEIKRRKIRKSQILFSFLKRHDEKLNPSTTVKSILANEQQPIDGHLSPLPGYSFNKQPRQHPLKQGDESQTNCQMSLKQQQLTSNSSHLSHADQSRLNHQKSEYEALPSFNNVMQQIRRSRSNRQMHQLTHIEPQPSSSQMNRNQAQPSGSIDLQYSDRRHPNNEMNQWSYNLTQPSCSHFKNANQNQFNLHIFQARDYQSHTLSGIHLQYQDENKQNHQVQQKRQNLTQSSSENHHQNRQINQMSTNRLQPHFQKVAENQQNSENRTNLNSDLLLIDANNPLPETIDFNLLPVSLAMISNVCKETNSSGDTITHQ